MGEDRTGGRTGRERVETTEYGNVASVPEQAEIFMSLSKSSVVNIPDYTRPPVHANS